MRACLVDESIARANRLAIAETPAVAAKGRTANAFEVSGTLHYINRSSPDPLSQ